jgi:hypothetical protein
MDFLNPHRDAIDDSEVINAAKLIAWQNSSPIREETQVRIGIQMFVSNVKLYARKYNLNGFPQLYICCVAADILHQGRGEQFSDNGCAT